MFSSRLSPCENDRKRMSTGSSSVCSVGATPGIDTQDINPEIQRFILQKCSHISKAVDFLVEQRNSRFAHVPEARIPDSDFRLFLKDIENHLLGIARVCGKETHNINLQHKTTRQSIPKLVDKSTKIRKIEERVDALETSVAKITEKFEDFSKIIKDQTTVEIETHESEGTYVEVGAVKHCVQLLESRNVVILSGREGSGKSRNGLEILKQLKEKNKDFDVFKFIGLNYVSDIVNCNTFHDWVNIDLNSEKFQLTTVEKEKILTNYCDLNKIKIFERVGDTAEQSVFHEAEIDDTETNRTVSEQVSVFVKRGVMIEIMQTDPFLGFPECCRLFTENRTNTTLDATIFKWPSHNLVKDIEKWRFEGDHDFMKGLKYVALVYILTVGRYDDINEYYLASDSKTICSLQGKNIDLKGTEIVQRVLQDGDNKILDEEELIDILIDYNEQERNMHREHEEKNEQVVEQLLQKTGVKYHDLNRLVGVALREDKVIEDALQQLGNGAHCEKTFRLIMKYYVDYIDVNILMTKAIDVGCHSVVEELLLKTVDNISYHLDTTLNKLRSHQQTCMLTRCSEKVVEQLLLATGVEYSNLSKFVGVAFRRGWCNALELLFKQDIDKSFHTNKVIEDALQQLGNGAHCEKTFRLIMKYYVDYIDVNILMTKAIDVGCHSVVEELLLKTVDNISYHLDTTLNKLMSHQPTCYLSRYSEKIVEQLLLATGIKYHDLNKVVDVACKWGVA
ncbi:unnamed protein product [Mytilus edulis]|uniref:Uncharacterized protein n=1 Tax=Mytilus edulis TaxID=6550 RepID=A0A8S3Q5Z6_MYTED|nr:unnamed protein product [Mytilus edulis]